MDASSGSDEPSASSSDFSDDERDYKAKKSNVKVAVKKNAKRRISKKVESESDEEMSDGDSSISEKPKKRTARTFKR